MFIFVKTSWRIILPLGPTAPLVDLKCPVDRCGHSLMFSVLDPLEEKLR